MEQNGNMWNMLEATVSYSTWARLTPTLTHVVAYKLATSGAEDGAMSNIAWDPLDKYTRAMMPKINDAHPTAIFDLIDLSVIDEWDSYPEGKLAAIPFGSEVRNVDLHDDIRNRIFIAAAEITKAQQISVSGPRPSAHARETRRYPSTFLIYDLSELQRRTLLERQVWSSTEITFRVVPILPCHSDFLFSIAGLTTLTTDTVRDMIFKVWQDKETRAMIQETI